MPSKSGPNRNPTTTWADRVALARESWQNQLRLTTTGIGSAAKNRISCGFWASTYYWAGWIAEVKIHDHIIIDINDPDAQQKVAGIIANVREACERARQDFPQSVPCLAAKKDEAGRLLLVESTIERPKPDDQRDFFPNDTIPIKIEAAIPDAPANHLGAIIAARRDRLHIEDSINPYFGPQRLLRYCNDLRWGYSLRIARRESQGMKVVFNPKSFTSETLSEIAAANLIKSSHQSVNKIFEAYAPGGSLHGQTSNGLPPGETAREMGA